MDNPFPTRHDRRSVRLAGYDYAQAGAYFVTVCTNRRECLFGHMANGEVRLTDSGRIIESCWQALPSHYPHVGLDAFVIMPDHVHGITLLRGDSYDLSDGTWAGLRPAPTDAHRSSDTVGAGLRPAHRPTPRRVQSLSEIVRALKSFSARRINEMHHTPGAPVWQRNYYEHIFRDEDEPSRARDYIVNNPLSWSLTRPDDAPAWLQRH